MSDYVTRVSREGFPRVDGAMIENYFKKENARFGNERSPLLTRCSPLA
jgi:hypothetical protein